MRVAMFGLGTMGLPMARTLCAADLWLVATDMVAEARDAFASSGGSVAEPEALRIEDADVVVTMLPEGDHVRAVHDAIRGRLSAGTVLLQCTDINLLHH